MVRMLLLNYFLGRNNLVYSIKKFVNSYINKMNKYELIDKPNKHLSIWDMSQLLLNYISTNLLLRFLSADGY